MGTISLKELLIRYTTKEESEITFKEKELFWYDDQKKKIIHLKGEKLKFVYKYDDELEEYRWLPEAEKIKHKKMVRIINKNEILSFIDKYVNYNNSFIEVNNVDNKGIYVSVPDNDYKNFIEELENSKLDFHEN